MTSGRLDAAPSKAAVLQQLCDRLKFSAEAAAALHKSLYRQKIDSILEEHNKITGARLRQEFLSQSLKPLRQDVFSQWAYFELSKTSSHLN